MDNSHLGRLPAELRNDIYALVLSKMRKISTGDPARSGRVQSAVTRVCRQLRQETKLLDCTKMQINTRGSKWGFPNNEEVTARWLQAIGPEACSRLHRIGYHFISEASSPDHRNARMEKASQTVELFKCDLKKIRKGKWASTIFDTILEMGVEMRSYADPCVFHPTFIILMPFQKPSGNCQVCDADGDGLHCPGAELTCDMAASTSVATESL
ncbi:hypothetical protein LTR17_007970 [Elasticomyces elasticus]|nr:hypothetical protein LTR17_007970 [Elasticomyces elasticus]